MAPRRARIGAAPTRRTRKFTDEVLYEGAAHKAIEPLRGLSRAAPRVFPVPLVPREQDTEQLFRYLTVFHNFEIVKM